METCICSFSQVPIFIRVVAFKVKVTSYRNSTRRFEAEQKTKIRRRILASVFGVNCFFLVTVHVYNGLPRVLSRHSSRKRRKKKRICEGIPCQGKRRRKFKLQKGPNACRKMGVFLRLLKWKYLSLGEVINPLMDTTPSLTQYTSI